MVGTLLNKDPKEIKISEIFLAVEEKEKTVGCTKEQKKEAMENLQSVLHMIYGDELEL
jgi:hypothetical protein